MAKTKYFIMGALSTFLLLWGNNSFAWDWNAPTRGWVDVITRYDTIGPIPKAKMQLRGWACLRPDLFDAGHRQPSTQVYVWQGGPPYQGGILLGTVDVAQEDRPDTVSYGACRNTDSGFSIWVNPIASLPQIFYVEYSSLGTVLEGQRT